jgi:Rad3-related DNA helicase
VTNTWQSYWKTLENNSNLQPRAGQQLLGESIFNNLFNKGHLVGEAPTGVGKSFAALIPAIAAVREKKHRTIVTTETLNLLDQIVDKDLPFLAKVYGGFTYAGLKGRNHYLCIAKVGRDHPIVQKVSSRLGKRGERRDVEKILGVLLQQPV